MFLVEGTCLKCHHRIGRPCYTKREAEMYLTLFNQKKIALICPKCGSFKLKYKIKNHK